MSRLKSQTGVVWPDGTTQDTAPFGAGLKYQYSTDTASSDPTSGFLKFNSTTLSSVTVMRISETDAFGNGVASVISMLDDNGSNPRATVFMVKENDPSCYLIFNISGALTDNGTWDNCNITYLASGGSFSNNDVVRLTFHMVGATGSTGARTTDGSWLYDGSHTTTSGMATGDLRFNNSDPALATALYLAHGSFAEGDPSTIFLNWISDGTKGFIKMYCAGSATRWMWFKFTSVSDSGTITTFNGTWYDSQPTTMPINNGERVYFMFDSTLSGSGGGDASTNTSTSVDSEIALFSGTAGKTLKRATSSGILKAASGVIGISSELGTIDGLSPSNDDFLQRKSGAWANRTVAQIKADLGLNIDYISLPALSFLPSITNGCSPIAYYEAPTNKQVIPYLSFINGTTKEAQCNFPMPPNWDGSTITAILYWLANSTSTNSVVWGVAGRSYGDAETVDQAWGTEQTVTDAQGSTAYQDRITSATSAITLAGTPAGGERISLRVRRVTGGSDTLAVPALLTGILLTYGKS